MTRQVGGNVWDRSAPPWVSVAWVVASAERNADITLQHTKNNCCKDVGFKIRSLCKLYDGQSFLIWSIMTDLAGF
jgi:hypothetical protein